MLVGCTARSANCFVIGCKTRPAAQWLSITVAQMLTAIGNSLMDSISTQQMLRTAVASLPALLQLSRQASNLTANIQKWEERAKKELKGCKDPYKALTHKTLDVGWPISRA